MTETAALPRSYPCRLTLADLEVTFRLMTADDKDAMLKFSRGLSEHDLLFLPVDITKDETVERWLGNIERGMTYTVLAEENEQLVGYCSLHRNRLIWTHHHAEIRLLVSSNYRGKGIGGQLARQIFAIAQGQSDLHKLIVQMMSTQRDAQALFHHLGFIPEAMLHEWVIDRNGRMHDLIMMSREVEDVEYEDEDVD